MLDLFTPQIIALTGLPGSEGGGAEGFLALGPLVIMFVIFYFLLIRPQQKRQKTLKEMINNLKRGDKVVTTGGLYGTVVGLEDSCIQLKIADQVKVKVSRGAISGMQEGDGHNEN